MCAVGAGVHALHVVLCAALYAALNVALYSGDRRGRAPFARGARVMRYVPEVVLHVLEADRRRAACVVGAVICCVLLVHGRCVMYAGCCALCARDAGGYAPCAALFAGGVRGTGGDAPCATLYAGGCGGWARFAGGAGGDTLCATLHAGGDAMYATLYAGSIESS